MLDSGQAAGQPRSGAARHRGAKPPGSAKQPKAKTVRLQLHLNETTVQRLGVHSALVGRNQSRLVDEILTSHLARYGKGREIFTDSPDVEVSDSAEVESAD